MVMSNKIADTINDIRWIIKVFKYLSGFSGAFLLLQLAVTLTIFCLTDLTSDIVDNCSCFKDSRRARVKLLTTCLLYTSRCV